MRLGPRFGMRAPAVAALAMALTASVLAGCGHAAPTPVAPPPPPPMPKYTSLVELGTASANQMKIDRFVKITMSVAASGKPLTDLEGSFLFDPAGLSLQTEQRVYNGDTAINMSMIALPDQAYVQAPGELQLPPGKSWARLRPDTTNPLLQIMGKAVENARQSLTPTQRLSEMSDAATIVESVEEPLDGVRTMRYRARVDLNQAITRVTDPSLQENFRRLLSLAQATGGSTLDYVFWLDERSRLLRFLIEQPLPAGQGTVKTEARYRDWGVPFVITAPPPDQVADA